MKGAAISLHDLSVHYGDSPALVGVTGRFEPGSLTAIAGPNGAGKSTLLKAFMGEVGASGRVELGGVRRADIGYLPQASAIDRSFPISVADVVCLGAWKRMGVLGGLSASMIEAVHRALHEVGLAGMQGRPIGALSVGQFQRVLFARLLVQDAQVIVLDEPFTALDSRTVDDLTQVIETWHRAGRTVIAVLHDLEQIHALFPQTLLLAHRVVAWGPTRQVLTAQNLNEARALAQDWSACTVGECQPS